MSLPRVAIVGRTNVGKSRLFNRLTESRRAIVTPIPGTTRDANEDNIEWNKRRFTLFDTGGWTLGSDNQIDDSIRERTEATVRDSDLVLFVIDGRAELTTEDEAFARWVRRLRIPTLLVVNKIENDGAARSLPAEVFRFGFGDPHLVSAMNGRGSGDLLDAIIDRLPKRSKEEKDEPRGLRLAFIGRPNVGKSSLMNALLGAERVIVSPEPFTTRDAIEIPFRWNNQPFRLIDTAGLRRRTKIPRASIEREGVAMTESALERADVILFVIDVSTQLSAQDRTIASQLRDSGSCVIMVANKWDQVAEKQPETIEAYRKGLISTFSYLRWAPIAFVSAKTGQRVTELLSLATSAAEAAGRQLSQPELDELLRAVVRRHPPTRGKGTRYPKIRTLEQIGTRPPQFEITIGAKEDLHPNYLAFVERMIRERYDFSGCPMRIGLRKLKQRG